MAKNAKRRDTYPRLLKDLVFAVFVSGDNLARLPDGFPQICLLAEIAEIVEGFLITLPEFYKNFLKFQYPRKITAKCSAFIRGKVCVQ